MGLFDRIFGPSAESKKRVEELQKRLKTNPTNVACAIALADAYVESNARGSAIKLLNQLGPALQKNGQFLAAIAVYKKAAQLDPKGEEDGTAISLRELKRLQTATASQSLPTPGPRSRTDGPGTDPESAALEQQKREQIHPLLENIPLFKDVPTHLVDQLIQKIHLRTYDAGKTLFEEGAPGSSLFFVVEGELSISGKGEKGEEIPLRTLGEGDVLGEMSFLSSLPRSATVRTKSPAALLELERRAVDPLVRKSPKLKEALDTLYRERVLNDVLVRSTIFASLPKAARDEIAARLVAQTAEAGSSIAGSSSPETLFLIAQGLVRLASFENGREVERAVLYPPAFFGNAGGAEGAIPLVASAVTDVELYRLDLNGVAAVLKDHPKVWAALDEMQAERLGTKSSGAVFGGPRDPTAKV